MPIWNLEETLIKYWTGTTDWKILLSLPCFTKHYVMLIWLEQACNEAWKIFATL